MEYTDLLINAMPNWAGVEWCFRCGGVVSVPDGTNKPHTTELCDCVYMGFESPLEQPAKNAV